MLQFISENVPIPVRARRWWEGVGAVRWVPAIVYSLYCPLLKLAFCTDLRCDDLLMGEDWDDDGKQTSTFRRHKATFGDRGNADLLIQLLCVPPQFSSLFIRLLLSITCFSSSRWIIFSSFSSSCFAWNLAWNRKYTQIRKKCMERGLRSID